MDIHHAAAAAEAILFAAGEPVALERLCLALGLDHAGVRDALDLLAQIKDKEDSGVRLIQLDGKAQLCTKAEYAGHIREALEIRKPPALTQTAMETLAIIAYRQPVTKTYVEQVRGVDSGYTVGTLVDKGLIEEAGRLDAPGRPILYRTTDLFLRTFGLSSLAELAPLGEGGEQLPLPQEQITE